VTPDVPALEDALNALAALYQFRSTDQRTFGTFTVSQSYCLRILYFRGARAMGELATELGVSVSTMTGIIDQLEAKALVARVDHPRDRRSLHVTLTAKGRKRYQAARDAFLAHLAPLFDRRSPEARAEIIEFLNDTITAIRGWRRSPRKAPRHGQTDS
jgi:DNA-binding MarR family transcriptional regulator